MTPRERELFNELLERARREGSPLEVLWHPDGGWAVEAGDLTSTGDTLEECLEGLLAVRR